MLQSNRDTIYRKDNVISVLKNNISNENLFEVLTTKGMATVSPCSESDILYNVEFTSFSWEESVSPDITPSLPTCISHLPGISAATLGKYSPAESACINIHTPVTRGLVGGSVGSSVTSTTLIVAETACREITINMLYIPCIPYSLFG